jgi:hypothetical protein
MSPPVPQAGRFGETRRGDSKGAKTSDAAGVCQRRQGQVERRRVELPTSSLRSLARSNPNA